MQRTLSFKSERYDSDRLLRNAYGLFCFLIISITILTVLDTTAKAQTITEAKKGVLDLRNWNPQSGEVIKLSGEWEFYWESFFPPQQTNPTSLPIFTGYAQVPNPWNMTFINGQAFPNIGYATYRLRVLLPDDAPRLLLRFRQVTSAYSLYINGSLLGNTGTPGMDKENSVPLFRISHFTFQPAGNEAVILLQTSNFHHFLGGIRQNVFLMEEKLGLQSVFTEIFSISLVTFTLGIIGLYHIVFFLLDRRDFTPLLFGLFTTAIAIRAKFATNIDLGYIIPMEGTWSLRIEYLTAMIAIPIFFSYIGHLFQSILNTKFLRWFAYLQWIYFIIGGFSAGIILFFPTEWSTQVIILSQGVVLSYIPLAFLLVSFAIYQRVQGSYLFFAAGLMLVISFLNDSLMQYGFIHSIYLVEYGVLSFVVIQAVILARRYASAFHDLEVVSAERERLVLQLKEHSRELEEKVAERTEELQDAVATKDRFFNIIAHDLRGPIGTIDAMLNQTSEEELVKGGLLSSLQNMASRSYQLLENLLLWASSQSGRITPEPNLFLVRDEFAVEFDLLNPTAKQKKIELQNEVPNNLRANADLKMFHTVIRNLVSNGIKYTQPGGIVTVSAEKRDKFIEISIRDTGVGLESEQIARIFSTGERSRSTPGTQNEKGTGLGLILCKELVEKNGGNIFAESTLGEGSIFRFTVPCEKPNALDAST